jgi:feruloyl-CoA synthase
MTSPLRAARVGGCLDVQVERRGDATFVRSTEPLGSHAQRVSDVLDHWADAAPDRSFVAQRGADGEWEHVSYAQMRDRARALGAALLQLGVRAERPLAILSGNDLAHASLMMAALWVGVPFVSVSPAYSLVSTDFAKLAHVLRTTTPGAIYASDPRFEQAIAATVGSGTPVILGRGRLKWRDTRDLTALLQVQSTPAVDAARAATTGDTVAKILFTSGSTSAPKGVVTTHRMLCANQQMIRQCLAFLQDEPPVMVDWLPWSHTFGSNHNLGIALFNGGTFFIDEGKPTRQGIQETIRNLREVSPTLYCNVPKGFEELAKAMAHDDVLRQSLFGRAQVFMYAAAGLAQPVWDELDRLGERAVSERVRIVTALGMTETAPACLFDVSGQARAGQVGLPAPGVEVKLVPLDGKTEIRFRGPNVMPGYWRDPARSAAAFDEDGFYRTGDAVQWVDAARPALGLRFDGRIAEDFKLSSGTFVNVGPLRARIIAAGYPLVQDVVVTGIDRDDVGALVVPRLGDCADAAGLPVSTAAAEVLAHPAVRDRFQLLLDRLWREGTGSANRVARLAVLDVPPSLDAGEVTDKGSLNQRVVLATRAALVDRLYAPDGIDIHLPNLTGTSS